ncbi:hypothetical protein [Arthrobacter sp. StoSoilB13]|uniref:hypothetical protein n=1 Tax=Arthrobacter sp. StoSoilB13 TaxID=2830993 RepID=UPI001CC7B568|nr:hypothetical protein [Arthrobacter sp. StoSoilB13]BCW47954.1 hypothetical protein StoSoilB13_02960 [Arthrobacter sp. StoSoilB13]
MSTERDELADMVGGPSRENGLEVADAILAAGYRKIFDGDCGLSNAAPDERDAAEAWMRWANILTIGPDEERNGIAAMKQMLTEFGYRKPRTITTVEELDALPRGSVILDRSGLSLHKNEFTGWRASNGAKDISPEMLAQEAFPATVLHESEVAV